MLGIPSDTDLRLNVYITAIGVAICSKLVEKKIFTEKDSEEVIAIAHEALADCDIQKMRADIVEEMKKRETEKKNEK